MPPSRLRSSARLFLLRFNATKTALSRAQNGGPHARASSPRPGRSTFTTSAPISPSVCVQNGPATFCVRSATTIPSSGSATDGSVAAAVVRGEPRSAAASRLEQQRAAGTGVGAVTHSRRPACVHSGAERAVQTEILEAALDDQDLFPEIVRNRFGGAHAGREAEQARDVTGARIAAQDLFFDARAAGAGGGRAGHRRPRQVIGPKELQLGLRHHPDASRLSISARAAGDSQPRGPAARP